MEVIENQIKALFEKHKSAGKFTKGDKENFRREIIQIVQENIYQLDNNEINKMAVFSSNVINEFENLT